jgi:hypothetical protein
LNRQKRSPTRPDRFLWSFFMNDPSKLTAASGRVASHVKSVCLILLVAFNAMLALSVTGVLRWQPAAHAGAGQPAAGRVSDYMIIPSHPLGLSQDVVFILDTESARITAAGYDANRGIEFTVPLDLRRR